MLKSFVYLRSSASHQPPMQHDVDADASGGTKPGFQVLIAQLRHITAQLEQEVEELESENSQFKVIDQIGTATDSSINCSPLGVLETRSHHHANPGEEFMGSGLTFDDAAICSPIEPTSFPTKRIRISLNDPHIVQTGTHQIASATDVQLWDELQRDEDQAFDSQVLAKANETGEVQEVDKVLSANSAEEKMLKPVAPSKGEIKYEGIVDPADRNKLVKRPWSDYPEFFNAKLPLPLVNKNFSKAEISLGTPVYDYGFMKHLVVHPNSRLRGIWVLIAVILLLYDVIAVPLNVCFVIEDSGFSIAVDMISTVFWTLDIPFNFVTGVVLPTHVEMRFLKIARAYASRWLFFDILLVLPEYVTLVAKDFPGAQLSVFRVARWGRLMRMLRLARLARVPRLKEVIRYVAFHFHLSRAYVNMTQGWMGMTVLFFVFIHMIASFWHGFGAMFDNGWIQVNDLGSASVGELYVVSVHWTCCRLYGIKSYYRIDTSGELLLDVVLIFLSMVCTSLYIAQVSNVVHTRAHSRPVNMWKLRTAYSNRHNLSPEVDVRLTQVLQASHYQCAGELVHEEETLLQTLPASLQRDLLFEARVSFLVNNQYFVDMIQSNQRVGRDVSSHAMSIILVVDTEVLFDSGDAGYAMLFVTSGGFKYDEGRADMPLIDVFRGENISEAVLWTSWQHCGMLLASAESTVLSLDASEFAKVIVNFTAACMHAVRYAKHFVYRLNHGQGEINDLTHFQDLTIETLNSELFDGTHEDHFMFISHYKIEAGAEASLLHDIIQSEVTLNQTNWASRLRSPVFVDSEDLSDLARLKVHVQNSNVLVVLLTPGYFTRPWCLLEIVIAIKHENVIVPVEVRKPGTKFEYPNEEWYANLMAGKVLDRSALRVLEDEGIALPDLHEAIRRVFLKIALPFSPHGTQVLRESEAKDILKRCNLELEQKEQSYAVLKRTERAISGREELPA